MKTPIPIIILIGFSFLFCFKIYPIESDPVFKPWLEMDQSSVQNGGWCGTPDPLPRPVLSEAAERGQILFKNNCASCHNVNLMQDLTGPALYGVMDRVPSPEWVYDWIRNSGAVIASGDAYGNMIYEEWNRTQMTTMEHLTDENIDDILAYLDRYQAGI